MRALQASALIVAIFVLGGTPMMAQQETARDHAKDRAAIEQTVERFLDAWNKHDAHSFAMTFTEDADFTNVAGMHARGRANVETFHAQIFATVFKSSHQTAQIRSIRFLAPDLAAVDVDWQMTGATFQDGRAQSNRKGLLNWVMAKQADGSWLIEVMHNTELTERPAITK
ncbi:MAG: SgcJ/EcaC family oxidoreductase [Candidatus Acidiferrales bacterium]